MKKILEISKLFNINNLDKYNKYINMFICKDFNEIVNILPDHVQTTYKKDLEKYEKYLLENDSSCYRDNIEKYYEINTFLKEYYIDYKVYNFLLAKEKNETLISTLKSFKNNTTKYNFVDTLTGRIKVLNGHANILTLPKRFRNIFSSKWKNEGSLLMVDFTSLEPRVAKKLTSNVDYIDIYESIKELTEDNLDRSVIKRAVISTLYGSSTSLDNISKEKTEHLMNICKEFFEYDKLYKISENMSERGHRVNYFSRPIWNANEERKNVIINNYIQSTSVDVSLMCFYNLIKAIANDYCRPIFIIHDAIIFDVHNSEKESFVNYVNQGYNCKKLGYFPLECTDFMETNK